MQQLKNLQKKSEGFTIIEVMIVLVIAAVIILIVFLAVPALQRNSRNNQRKNDVSRISAAVTESANNANGTLPTTAAAVTTLAGNLAFFTTLNYDDDGTLAATTDANSVTYVRQGTCVTSGTPAVNTGASAPGTARQFAIVYAVETSTSTGTPQCIQG